VTLSSSLKEPVITLISFIWRPVSYQAAIGARVI
jgi:hypothetical protein